MTDHELDRELRTVLARLELVSGAKTQAFNSDGGGRASDEHPGGVRPPGDPETPADHYRRRLQGLDDALSRRVTGAQALTDPDDRKARIRAAWGLWDTDRRSVLEAAQHDLEAMTGRTGEVPKRRAAPIDTPAGLAAAAKEDAPGKPSKYIARQFGATEYQARRWYQTWGLDSETGQPLAMDRTNLASEVIRLSSLGYGERAISRALKKSRGTVRRMLGKAA